jgi:hypothetical protein
LVEIDSERCTTQFQKSLKEKEKEKEPKSNHRSCASPAPLVLSDETFFHPHWQLTGKHFPIWATRIRG